MNTIDSLIHQIESLKEEWKHKEALDTTLKWLETHMNDYRLYEELADIYMFQENIEKAEEVIQYARELHPESSTWLYLQWCILREKWEYEKALSVFNEVNNMIPNTWEILQNLWWCHMMLGSMQKSIAILNRAHKLEPNNPEIIKNLNTAYLLAEDTNTTL